MAQMINHCCTKTYFTLRVPMRFRMFMMISSILVKQLPQTAHSNLEGNLLDTAM
ncbi:hypothetical protein MKW92_021404, partial [Papaver armeniacum]